MTGRRDPEDELRAACARYGTDDMWDVLRIKVREGLTPVDAIMAIAREMLDAEDAERKALHDQALTVPCPYCRAAPVNGAARCGGSARGHLLAWRYGAHRWDHHRSRYNASVAASLEALAGED